MGYNCFMHNKSEENGALVRYLVDQEVLKTSHIINAFKSIDRKDFVPNTELYAAYENHPLSIGYGQTISQPQTVAFMLELLQPSPKQKIMDVGSGSGWQSALLAHIVGDKGKVFAIELISELKEIGEQNIEKYKFVSKGIVECFAMNAEKGLPDNAPFDRIVAAAELSEIPQAWRDQLAIGGRIVAPVGNAIVLLTKTGKDTFEEKIYPGFVFVPFIPGQNT